MISDAAKEQIRADFAESALQIIEAHNEMTLVIAKQDLLQVLGMLKEAYQFDQLMDVCGVDYGAFGLADWATETTTSTGFSRGAMHPDDQFPVTFHGCRYGVSYHLLSTKLNQRLRVRAMVPEDDLIISSVIDLWASAQWSEREVFDLFGILFDGHPDLRRILTDYGFIGHPFRKDFPISGHLEMRYDQQSKRVVYGPVEIEPRVTVARVIRKDNRYADLDEQGES